jgi:hypothetical protein
MTKEPTYSVSCFCGAVRFTVRGAPARQGYCHCNSCRHWSASPVNGFSLWPPESIEINEGENNIETFAKTGFSHRKWCKTCGGHVMTEHPSMDLIDVSASLLPDLPFEPELHVHYGESVLHISDGVRKLKDLSQQAGGSGVELPE